MCLFSRRHIDRHVSRCAEYEFEDIICEVDDANLLVPEPRSWYPSGRRVANRLARHARVACVNPGLTVSPFKRDYEVFVTICQQPADLLALNAVRGWSKRCRTSVCWLVEAWASECDIFRHHLKLLRQFDYVFLMFRGSVQPIEKIVGKRCLYLPPGVDAISFCPYPNPPERCVDVLSIGRAGQRTHEALLRAAQHDGVFYIYDTTRPLNTLRPRQHRALVANVAKRSRYFIANAPKINEPWQTGGQSEISYRFVEGAASGTVMLGDTGEDAVVITVLNWPDAVVRLPYDSTDIANVLADLDSQPARLARIRKDGIVNSLLRHDWVYRWRTILEMLGLKPKPALLAREKRLAELAKQVEEAYRQDDTLAKKDK